MSSESPRDSSEKGSSASSRMPPGKEDRGERVAEVVIPEALGPHATAGLAPGMPEPVGVDPQAVGHPEQEVVWLGREPGEVLVQSA